MVLQIVVDTLTVVFRTLIFVPMILYKPENALLAFGVAQLAAMLFHSIAHYVYFHWYMKRLNIERLGLKKKLDESQSDNEDNTDNKNNDFPFKSVREFLPGQLKNQVDNAYKRKKK